MDDLISRKSLLSAYDEKHKGPAGGARKLIEDEPSVSAVPLDKLCALLAQNADCPPEHSPVQDHCKGNCAECWESVLKEWMEEQNATD